MRFFSRACLALALGCALTQWDGFHCTESRGCGSDTLLGGEAIGRPTRNKLKTTFQATKQAAWEYADGDASLRSRVEELLDQDRQRAERMRVAGTRAEASARVLRNWEFSFSGQEYVNHCIYTPELR